MTQCSFVDGYRHFGDTCCLHLTATRTSNITPLCAWSIFFLRSVAIMLIRVTWLFQWQKAPNNAICDTILVVEWCQNCYIYDQYCETLRSIEDFTGWRKDSNDKRLNGVRMRSVEVKVQINQRTWDNWKTGNGKNLCSVRISHWKKPCNGGWKPNHNHFVPMESGKLWTVT